MVEIQIFLEQLAGNIGVLAGDLARDVDGLIKTVIATIRGVLTGLGM